MVTLDYVIKNYKNVYIKLDDNGRPVTCDEEHKGLFEYSKAKNILGSLPKTLKKMNFNVDCIPDIQMKNLDKKTVEPKIIQENNYIVSENITRWVDKFGTCGDLLNEARQRKEELIGELSTVDKKFSDIIHQIEFEDRVNMYIGWQERNKIKEIRKERRNIKDELLIVENVLREVNVSCLQRERVQNAINGLSKRKYTLRIVEENDKEE